MGKLIYGVGYSTIGRFRYDGTKRTKPYSLWHNMLRRVYDNKLQAYSGCSVVNEWHDYDNFLDWFSSQNYKDSFQLDKDLYSGVLYSPETCCFLSPRMNKFIETNHQYTQILGCEYNPSTNMFNAVMKFSGKKWSLGWFENVQDCYRCYKEEKKRLLLGLPCLQSHDDYIVSELLKMRWLDRGFKLSLNKWLSRR